MLIEKTFAGYNERRYSRPWGAKITFPNGVKPSYEFVGHWDGRAVIMKAEAGDVVAFGQKDNRGNNTIKEFFVVGENGDLRPVSESEARAIVNAKV